MLSGIIFLLITGNKVSLPTGYYLNYFLVFGGSNIAWILYWEGSCWWLLSNSVEENTLTTSAVQNLPNFSTALYSLPENHYLHFRLNGQNFNL